MKHLQQHINKIENRIAFNIKTGYYPELSTTEMMKLYGSIRNYRSSISPL